VDLRSRDTHLLDKQRSNAVDAAVRREVLCTQQPVEERAVNVQQVTQPWKQGINGHVTHAEVT